MRNQQPKSWNRSWVAIGVCAALGVAALPLDLSVSQLIHADHLRGDFRKLFTLAQVFSHGVGVAWVALTMFVLDCVRRPWMPRTLACAATGGLLAHAAKALVVRARPTVFGHDVRGEGLVEFPGSVWNSFSSYAELAAQDTNWFDYMYHSMPSGHTATAVGLAMGLTTLYPRGRWVFYSIAVLAGLQRIVTSAHYLSDVLMGAAIGIFGATMCLQHRGLGGWFDRLEGRLASPRSKDEPSETKPPSVRDE